MKSVPGDTESMKIAGVGCIWSRSHAQTASDDLHSSLLRMRLLLGCAHRHFLYSAKMFTCRRATSNFPSLPLHTITDTSHGNTKYIYVSDTRSDRIRHFYSTPDIIHGFLHSCRFRTSCLERYHCRRWVGTGRRPTLRRVGENSKIGREEDD